jgi:hypothetical protein
VCFSKDVEADVEACEFDLANNYVGVMSDTAGFKMNKDLEGGKYVGLVGRLPVRIRGIVDKGDFIVPTVDGCARAGQSGEEVFKIGVAIENNYEDSEKLVECIIK